MFYVIYIAVIVFALYLIFHDRQKGEGEVRRKSGGPATMYRPEQQGPVPQTPVRPVAKPQEEAQPRPVRPAAPNPDPIPRKPSTVPQNPAPRIARPAAARPAASTYDLGALLGKTLSWSFLDALRYDGSLDGCTLDAEITGMRYYCSFSDLGPVNGVVRPEPTNQNDPRAQVVIRADGKKLGYIPKTALPEYEAFNPDRLVCPFVGEVKVTRQGYMWADILVALPKSPEFVKEALKVNGQ